MQRHKVLLLHKVCGLLNLEYICSDCSSFMIHLGINGGKLMSATVCPSAQQAISSHYNLHNLYGWSETKVTAR